MAVRERSNARSAAGRLAATKTSIAAERLLVTDDLSGLRNWRGSLIPKQGLARSRRTRTSSFFRRLRRISK